MRLGLAFFSFLVSVLTLAVTMPAAALTLDFHRETTVGGPRVTVGDVADCLDGELICQALLDREVARAPAPGGLMRLAAVEVGKTVRRLLPQEIELELTGAANIDIRRVGRQITADDILTRIDEYLRDQAARFPEAEIRFTPTERPLPFMLPEGEISWEIIPASPGLLGSSRIAVLLKVDGKVRKNLSIPGKLEVFAPVAVAKEALAKGDLLSPEQFSLEKRDLSGLDAPVTNLQTVAGLKLNRSLKAGEILTNRAAQTPPVVHRGELVKLVARQGAMLVTAQGVAQSDGALGQMIRVENSNSKKIVRGQVSGPGVVEVPL
ncbi:MAG: flagellar basal body P-ring formation chaperone FlgA [Desulfobulbaceae bacterium]|jgi:flagella basal body P-ring formation protein FlgA|nr:flagellar basal body P-ring formation chaperone FlgA [Desulfobulbaceae bacterium]